MAYRISCGKITLKLVPVMQYEWIWEKPKADTSTCGSNFSCELKTNLYLYLRIFLPKLFLRTITWNINLSYTVIKISLKWKKYALRHTIECWSIGIMLLLSQFLDRFWTYMYIYGTQRIWDNVINKVFLQKVVGLLVCGDLQIGARNQ